MLAYLESFSYMSYAVLSGEFVLHSRCCFMWEVSLLTSSSSMREGRGLTPHWSKTLRKNPSHWKRETTAKSVGYSAALLAYTAAHDTGFVGTQMASMGPSARSGHSHRWPGKYGAIGFLIYNTIQLYCLCVEKLASSQYRLERLRADMTFSVRFVLNFGLKKLVLFCTFQCSNITTTTKTKTKKCLGTHFYAWFNSSFCRPFVISKSCKELQLLKNCNLLRSCEPTIILLLLILVRSFSYTPDVSFSKEFLLHSCC